jgi:xanthine dehydrogenase molybdopterin binding subunit
MSTHSETSIPHESAQLHVTGEAVYIDDILVNERLLHGRVVTSRHASARIVSYDLDAARSVMGIHAVLSCRDIPGSNDMGPVVHDEPCLADGEVRCVGQAMFLIAGETEEACREAERRITVVYDVREPVLSLEAAIAQGALLGPPMVIERGNVAEALAHSPNVITGELRTGAQEHWYLESQNCLCIPGEGDEMNVFATTQHPSETQALVARVLGIGKHQVVVEVRRIGGAFGGKETQANHVACWSALLSRATGRPVKIRLFRDDDMMITGKRHRFVSRYEIGFDDAGRLLAAKIDLHCDGGCATDLTFAILQRAMLHVDNAYFIPALTVVGTAYRTNLPSNTAFRGFGGPQGMAVIENAVDRVARKLAKDPLEIRRLNFYGTDSDNITHYGEVVENNRLHLIHDTLVASSDYAARRKEIARFNSEHEFLKKGLAMTPVKFGISFTTSFLNQATALVIVYRDGTILVNHGGTEMGQGLHTKIGQIAAAEFGVSIDRVKVNATNTSRIPNMPATAASSGTDLNGAAVKNAIDQLKSRIADAMAARFNASFAGDPTRASDVVFEDDLIRDGRHPERSTGFAAAMDLMILDQVSLTATGFYKTPAIGWDKEKGRGRPFHYFAFGMAVTEVLLDVLTGGHTILRADILHDVGDSLNPGIDIGQVEGGYVQGVGWVTTEEIIWDGRGNLLTHSPDTYKIPTIQDIPVDFRTSLLKGVPNPVAIRKSKAVAEPPFMLAFSAWLAIKDAVSAVGGHAVEPDLPIPATVENIVLAMARMRPAI